MDKTKYLARLEDDPIAQAVFAGLSTQKAIHHKDQIGMMSQVLDQVVIDKMKKVQEEQVKHEADAFEAEQVQETTIDHFEGASPRNNQDKGVFTV